MRGPRPPRFLFLSAQVRQWHKQERNSLHNHRCILLGLQLLWSECFRCLPALYENGCQHAPRTISDAAAQNLPSHVRGSMVVAMMRAVVVMVAVVFRHRRKHHNLLISAPLGFSFPYLLRSMRTLVAVLLSAPHGCHRCPAQCPSELLPKPR